MADEPARTNGEGPEANGRALGWGDRAFTLVPRLNREERKELVDRIRVGAGGGVDFVVMTVLSATLATLGLLQGSAAVVIGAMLVAPLVGPLVGSALALVQANLQLFKSSLWTTSAGILLGLAVSSGITAVSPGFEPSLEIHARGQPDLLDLGIAFASGMVAAWAMGRTSVSGTIAGVAIAAALVPPLAVVGIALTSGIFHLAGNAAILLVTNVVAIILGGALVFRVMGVGQSLGEDGAPAWSRFALMFLSLFVVLLIAPLFLGMLEAQRAGPRRSLIYAVAPSVTDAVRRYLAGVPGTDLIVVSRDSPEPHAGITVLVESDSQQPETFFDALRQIVVRARGEGVEVRIFTLLSARVPELVADPDEASPDPPPETPAPRPPPSRP